MILSALLIGVCYIITWYIWGVLYNAVFRRKDADFIRTFLGGMFLYEIAFSIFVIPLKLKMISLTTIAIAWGCIWAGSLVCICVFFRKNCKAPVLSLKSYISDNRLFVILISVFVFVEIVFSAIYGRWSSSNNPAEYVAYVTTAVFTDQLGTTDPWTGMIRQSFEPRLLTQTFLDHSAVVAKIFHVHPLVEIRHVVPAMFYITGAMAVFLLAQAVFRKSSQQTVFFFVYQAASAVTTRGYLLPGYYLFFRNYEGKDAVPALVIPLAFYTVWKLYEDPEDKEVLLFGSICMIGSYFYSGSTMYLVPVIFLAFIPGIIFCRKHLRMFCDFLLLLAPHILYTAYYMAATNGTITWSILK
ncbi:MAG: DUF6077 domain-containing protein [Bilifractor sp.]